MKRPSRSLITASDDARERSSAFILHLNSNKGFSAIWQKGSFLRLFSGIKMTLAPKNECHHLHVISA